jgi:threonylcarbamoyladenosine tRNA methylthiotransferase MtaB
LHIPLQSGSDRILKAMNRGYTTDFFEQLINSIITGYPDISIGTDVITGFPGESDKDFNDTVKLINRLPLSYIHVFPYSKRPDTRALLYRDQINDKVKKERVKYLRGIGKSKKIAYMTRHLGNVLDVIVEQKTKTHGYYGAISGNYLKLLVKSDNLTARDNIKVRVTSLTDLGLMAEPLK